MSAPRITPALLSRLGACQEQVTIFRKVYPRGVVPSPAVVRRLLRAGVTGKRKLGAGIGARNVPNTYSADDFRRLAAALRRRPA